MSDKKVKTKILYRNKKVEKRSKAFDKRIHEEGEKKKTIKKDPIIHAHKESSKSPKKMFKESMEHLHKLINKKK